MKSLICLMVSMLTATGIYAESGKTIILDPGHEPWNRKMANTRTGESGANLVFAKSLESIINENEKYGIILTLDKNGYNPTINEFEKTHRHVVHARRKFSRDKPKADPTNRYHQMLYSRGLFFHKRFSKNIDAEVFVSLHYNEPAEKADYHGFCVYYSTKGTCASQSKELAIAIRDALVDKGYQTSTNGGERHGYAEGNFAVLRMASIEVPAVLIEIGYISNTQDKKDANDLKKTEAKAGVVYQALDSFLSRRR